MSTLKFNFNKPKPATKPPLNTSNPAFEDEEDEDNVLTKTTKTKKQPTVIAGLNEDLRSYTSLSEETSARMAKEALEVDPTGVKTPHALLSLVFDYDAVYDELKTVEVQKKQLAEQDRLERKVKPRSRVSLTSSQNTWTSFLLLQKCANGII